MITIKEALGDNFKNILLKDNESLHGGIGYQGETLENLMEECEIKPEDDYGEFCIKLEQAGLKAIRPIAFVDQRNRFENGLKVYNLLKEW